MTILQSYTEFVEKLRTIYHTSEAETIADWVFEDLCRLPRITRRANAAEILPPEFEVKLNSAMMELLQNKPVSNFRSETSRIRCEPYSFFRFLMMSMWKQTCEIIKVWVNPLMAYDYFKWYSALMNAMDRFRLLKTQRKSSWLCN